MKLTPHNLVLIVLCIIGIVLLNIGFVFLLLGLLPTIVTYIIDDNPEKDMYKTVRAANVAGILPTAVTLTDPQYAAAILQISMGKPGIWMTIYGSAGLGWLLVVFCKWGSYLSIVATGEARVKMLEKAQKDLIEEWGEDITEFMITTSG